MHQNLKIFRISHALASHAGTRQAVIAQNIAQADTPGYRALDVQPFSDFLRQGDSNTLRATRPRHLNAALHNTSPHIREAPTSGNSSPNGNTVSLEEQMLEAVDVKRAHDRALAIYKSGLGILRTSLGRR